MALLLTLTLTTNPNPNPNPSPRCPLLFLHGCGSFHDAAWAEALNRRPQCAAQFICRDHWFFQAEPRRTRDALCAWLRATQ